MKKYVGVLAGMAAALSMAVMTPASAADEVKKDSWFIDTSGRFYYFDSSSKAVTGEQTIDGDVYLFSDNGVLKTGWRTVGGKRRYYDPETGKPVYGWLDYCGKQYYISKDDGKAADEAVSSEDGMSVFDAQGVKITEEGFTKAGGKNYYITSEGKVAVGETAIDGNKYFFGTDGEQLTGWQTDSSGIKHYYDPATGQSLLGIIKADGGIYYLTANGIHAGWAEIAGSKYYFDPTTGRAAYGITKIGDTSYYFGENCVLQSGWFKFEDGYRFFGGDDAHMYVGKATIGEKRYFFNADGIMMTGRVAIDNEKFYFGEDGALRTGLVTLSDGTYYFGADGAMSTGFVNADGVLRYFGTNGVMVTGWFNDGTSRYYSDTTGKVLTGLQNIGGSTYYLGTDGKLHSGRIFIDNDKYYFNEETGAMVRGWATFSDGKYYFGSDGKMMYGWQTIDNKLYHLNTTSGKLDTNIIFEGYNLTADGTAIPLSNVQKTAQNVLNQTGTGLSAIYNYVRGHNYYRYIEDTRTLAAINTTGWSYFANYAFNNTYVVCYYFAAITDCLMKQAGYTTRVVYGTGHYTSDHYWNQVFIDGAWHNIDTCNGYYYVTDAELMSHNYTFYQFVYPTYY